MHMYILDNVGDIHNAKGRTLRYLPVCASPQKPPKSKRDPQQDSFKFEPENRGKSTDFNLSKSPENTTATSPKINKKCTSLG